MSTIMGIFSDVPAGTVIFLVILVGLCIKFGGSNLFKDSGGGSGKSGSGGGTSSSTGSTGSSDNTAV